MFVRNTNIKHNVDIHPLVEELNSDNSKFDKFVEKYTKVELRNMIIVGLKKGYKNLVKCYVEKITDDTDFDFDVVINVSAKCGYLDIIEYLHSNNKINLDKLKDMVLKKSSFHSKPEILNWMMENNFLTINEILVYNAKIGNIEIIKFFVEEKNQDIHFKEELVLRTCGYHGHLDAVKYLCGLGCDIKIMGDSVLRTSAESGFINIVKFCISSGSDIHSNLDEALRKSCIYGHYDVVKFLVESGANVSVNSNEPICKACAYGHIEIVKLLIANKSVDINANNSDPLRLSLKNEYIDIFNLLVSEGADLISNGNKLLYVCVENNQLEIIRLLCSKQIHLLTDNSKILCKACELGSYDLIELLINKHTNINCYDSKPLCKAIEGGFFSIVKLLLDLGANPNLLDNGVISNCANKYPEIVKLILNSDFDITILSDKTIKKLIKNKLINENEFVNSINLSDNYSVNFMEFLEPIDDDDGEYDFDIMDLDGIDKTGMEDYDLDELTINID